MNKLELLKQLDNANEFEEEVILQLDKFIKTLLIHSANIFPKEKKEILKLYNTLTKESKKHSSMLNTLKNKVEKSKKNGF